MISFRKASIDDTQLYFEWTNDPEVRNQSFKSQYIDFETHQKWFQSKLEDENCLLLIFQNEAGLNIGQVRIQIQDENQAIIGVSLDKNFRGKGYSSEMIKHAVDYFFSIFNQNLIHAYIKINFIRSRFLNFIVY